ncbi:glycerol-3-phosphate dehydrogenase/oxidase [Kaistia algarum]|uniref:glycerol-3-phosphate dehydrogenase/oxidase n=1 Tax=Kaistia algarum TaxID=2083279 RepID=UPI000CE7EC3E|nr:FAD-dependent oxidoreductase [Kaistia algarum]MCX5514945.1 FAD-dependent oxidoreductase [Kaistia algarum]PPE79692.1 glycerol-3-phosphate dehydrogenase/oxidase [Kaistia algarum]
MADGVVAPPAPILDRERMRAEVLADSDFDAVVIGGGITGAGTFRDLCLQGLRVLLVERDDFASGASGALTRIAHGGFRYLERGEIGLVRDSVVERDRLVNNAPHAVQPITVVLPLSSWLGGLVAAPLRFLKLAPKGGMPGIVPMALGRWLYDALAGVSHALPRGRIWTGAALARRFPYLAGRFAGALSLGEARILMPERVAIELIEDGVAAGERSAAFNYCALVGVEGDRLRLRDRLTDQELEVTARVVVNAAGAHADKVAALFGISERITGGVAGTHLILEAPDLAATLGEDLLFFEDSTPDPAHRRLLVCYRLSGDRVLLGTTESACDDPDEAVATADDETYLLRALTTALPSVDIESVRIVGHMVGVRPLVRSASHSLASRSRDHAVFVHRQPLPVISIVGGKWTTFRRMAEDASDAVLRELGQDRTLSTRDLPIGGGKGFPREDAERRALLAEIVAGGVESAMAERLLATYGTRARIVSSWIRAVGGKKVLDGSNLTIGEVAFFRAAEMAISQEDILRRRSDAWQAVGSLDSQIRD